MRLNAANIVDTEYPVCKTCGHEMEYEECWNCGGTGYSHHECGEDCCCCADPIDNVPCDNCDHLGGYWICQNCIDKNTKAGEP